MEATAVALADPLERLAADFGVQIQDVRLLADAARAGGFIRMPVPLQQDAADAARRCFLSLGNSASYALYDRVKQATAACHH